MKYKLLSIENKDINNIGDYVQALASSQFLPHIDGFIDRDSVSNYNGEDCKVIMNGWFMHNPSNWPPSKKINPLFISFHVNKLASEKMLDEKGINYLKLHEPIGCRDFYTRDLLLGKGIRAYFSGCLTLTLGNNFKSASRERQVVFVDPLIPQNKHLSTITKDIVFMVSNTHLVNLLSKKLQVFPSCLKNRLIVARFARMYSKLFSKETLLNATYIKQEDRRYSLMSNEERLCEAERLVKIYSKASLVITKRIHTALPCLGLETPVYFIQREDDSDVSKCRFGGLTDLFNTITLIGDKLRADFETNGKISLDNVVQNKDKWVKLAVTISDTCKSFVNEE